MQCKALARAFTKTKAYQQVSNTELQLMYFMWLLSAVQWGEKQIIF
jgi:hypothetical protein